MRVPFQITDAALTQVKAIQARKEIGPEFSLRVGIKGAFGCAGVAYLIGFDKEKSSDVVFELGGVKILVEKGHLMHLAGMKIDWLEEETQRGFAFLKE